MNTLVFRLYSAFSFTVVLLFIWMWEGRAIANPINPTANHLFQSIQLENSDAEVVWSDEGYVERLTNLNIDLGISDYDSVESAAREFALENRELFGLSVDDVNSLIVKTFIRGNKDPNAGFTPYDEVKRFAPITIIKFYQYKKDYFVTGTALSFLFGSEMNLLYIYNRTIPNLADPPEPIIDHEEAQMIVLDNLNIDKSTPLTSEMIIRGHQDNLLAWQVKGANHVFEIDAETGEILDKSVLDRNWTTARARVYEDKAAYDSGDWTSPPLWLWSITQNYYSGSPSPWTRPIGKYFEMYDYTLLSDNPDDDTVVDSRHSNAVYGIPSLPYFAYDVLDDDDDTPNPAAVNGNTYWHLAKCAYDYSLWGFDDDTTSNNAHHVTVLVNHSSSGCNPGGLQEYNLTSALDNSHDTWTVIHLGRQNINTTGGAARPPVIYHEYNHWVAHALTGYTQQSINKCENDWGSLDEALAKFMGDSMWDADPAGGTDNWQMDQQCCTPSQYMWHQNSNWFCCRQDNNDDDLDWDVHDFGLSLATALWGARQAINNISAGDGRDFVNQVVFLATSFLSTSENLHSAAWQIYTEAAILENEWCIRDQIWPCPYSNYAEIVTYSLALHGYLTANCYSGVPETECTDPASVFCPRRGDDPPPDAEDCTRYGC